MLVTHSFVLFVPFVVKTGAGGGGEYAVGWADPF
jgi:hypothetical protein